MVPSGLSILKRLKWIIYYHGSMAYNRVQSINDDTLLRIENVLAIQYVILWKMLWKKNDLKKIKPNEM